MILFFKRFNLIGEIVLVNFYGKCDYQIMLHLSGGGQPHTNYSLVFGQMGMGIGLKQLKEYIRNIYNRFLDFDRKIIEIVPSYSSYIVSLKTRGCDN